MATNPSNGSPDYLITESEHLAANAGFELVGRKADLELLTTSLMKRGIDRHLIVVGPSGAGISSLVTGLEASKKNPTTPPDIIEKNFFHLNVDKLFSSSDSKAVSDNFEKAVEKLGQQASQGQKVVLVIEDAKGFLAGIVDSRATDIMNKLVETAKAEPNFQILMTTNYQGLQGLFDSNANIEKLFSLREIGEPSKDDLRPIAASIAKDLEKQYNVTIPRQAIDVLADLTEKVPLSNLPAQPKRTRIILEGAITSHLLKEAGTSPELAHEQETLAIVTEALESGLPAKGELADRTPDQLAQIRDQAQAEIERLEAEQGQKQGKLAKLNASIVDGQAAIQKATDSIEALKARSDYKNDALDKLKAANEEMDAAQQEQDQGKIDLAQQKIDNIKKDFKDRYNEVLNIQDEGMSQVASSFNSRRNMGGGEAKIQYYATEIKAAVQQRSQFEAALRETIAQKEALIQTGSGPSELSDDDVLAEFGRLSGVEVKKLNQDDTEKLKNLSGILGNSIFGQPEPLHELAEAVKANKAGLKEPEEAVGNFLMIGPSGTGKTETARVLAAALFDDEDALNVWPMENFQESNAVTQLVGAPPGYAGYEAGGQLTEKMKKRPACVNVYDEIEKAHEDLFDAFLNVTSEHAFLLDRKTGAKVSFANAINIFTSNLGSQYFLDPKISFNDAKKLAMTELKRHFRPEFLNRLTVLYYKSLEQEQVVKIANKNLRKLDSMAIDKGITLSLSEKDVEKMCEDVYTPWNGARGIGKFIKSKIRPYVTEAIFDHPNEKGNVEVTYIPGKVSDEEKAGIRAEVEEDEEFDIRSEIEGDQRFLAKLVSRFMKDPEITQEQDEPAKKQIVNQKVKEAINARVKEQVEEKIAEKIKEAEIENSVVDARFVPAGSAKPASGPGVAANGNAADANAARPAAQPAARPSAAIG